MKERKIKVPVIYKIIAKKMPGLDLKLKQASIQDSPEEYIKKTFFTSIFLSLSICFIIFLFTNSWVSFLVAIPLIPATFSYFNKYVDVKIEQLKRKIDAQLVYAGNFLIIELDSGVPIHKAFENIEKNYDVIGVYFRDIMNRVYLGTSLEDAINETVQFTPSAGLRRVLWQVINSLKTGTNPSPALQNVIQNIVKEQQISVQEYGKKLSPMAMFYMMLSIIVPSLGITMLVVFGTFLGLHISMTMFVVIAVVLGFVQFMFLSLIQSMRPPINV